MSDADTARSDTVTLVNVSGDRIGDALIKLPVIRAYKKARPDSRLIWMTSRRPSIFKRALAPLVEGVIDEIHEQTGVGLHWRDLLGRPWRGTTDCVIATEQKVRNALVLKKIPHRLFISPAANFLFSDRRPPPGTYGATVYAQLTALLSLAADTPLALDPRIDLPAGHDAAASRILPPGRCYVGLAPGAAANRKRWPLENYIALAHALHARGHSPQFFLGPDERDLLGPLRVAVPQAGFPEYAADDEPLGDPLLTIALARQLRVSVANDAGAGHLLAAGGHPLITLFGHTDEHKFAPPYASQTAVRARDYGGVEMWRIPLDAVEAAVARVLGGIIG